MRYCPVSGLLVCNELSGNLGLSRKGCDGPQALLRVFV